MSSPQKGDDIFLCDWMIRSFHISMNVFLLKASSLLFSFQPLNKPFTTLFLYLHFLGSSFFYLGWQSSKFPRRLFRQNCSSLLLPTPADYLIKVHVNLFLLRILPCRHHKGKRHNSLLKFIHLLQIGGNYSANRSAIKPTSVSLFFLLLGFWSFLGNHESRFKN